MDGWPIVGRDHELARVAGRILEPPATEGRRGALLVGVPGVGKTRLARELYRLVRRRRLGAVWATASRTAQHQPFGAFAAYTREGDETLALLARLAAEISPGDRPTAVFVDDVHALDPMSALLVQTLARRPNTSLVLTARTPAPLPDVIVDLWKDDVVERMEVPPLDEAGTGRLASAIIERPLDAVAAHRLWERSRGNPLYITHIAQDWRDALADDAAAAPTDDDAGGGEPLPFVPDDASPLPGELGALIEQTLYGLDDTELEVLDAVSLLEPFPLAAIIEAVPDADVRLLDDLEARGVIVAAIDDPGHLITLRAAHPLFAEARRAAMGPLRARRLRTRILDAVARTGVDLDIVARSLLSLQADGDAAPGDAALHLEAAATAFARLDLDLTARMAKASAERGGPPAATILAAYALSLRSHPDEAAALLAPLLDAPQPPVDAVIVDSGNRFFVLGDAEGAIARAEAARAASADDGDRAELAAMLAWEHAFVGRPAAALEFAEAALTHPGHSDRATAFATIARITAFACAGRSDEVAAVAEPGYAAARGGYDAAVLRTVLLDAHLLALHLAGRMHEAAALAERVLAEDRDAPPPFDGRLLNLTGRVLVRSGRVSEALATLAAAQAAIGGHDHTGWSPLNLTDLAEAAALAGDPARARRALEQARAQWMPAFRYRLPQFERVAAIVDAAAGRAGEAEATAIAAADLAMEQDAPALAVRALHDAVRHGGHGLGDRLRETGDGLDGPRARLAPRHADAWDRGDAEALDDLSRAFESEGDLVAATDAAAQAAVHWAAAGRGGRAAASKLRVRGLEATTGRLHTLAVARASLGPGLSEREVEIAGLIARGSSDREIAVRLGLSTRTVEAHAHRIYAKLGVEGRAQLRGLADDG